MKNVRKLLTTPLSLIGILLILVYLIIAILAPVLAPPKTVLTVLIFPAMDIELNRSRLPG